jgi:glycine cleavage system H protein
MTIPSNLKFTKDHEWIKKEGNEALIGITDYAQSELGEIVFLELPEAGAEFKKESVFGTVEAVKAVSDLFMPASGVVIATNSELDDKPELVNEEPYGKGWMIRIKLSDEAELDNLMTPEAYEELTK